MSDVHLVPHGDMWALDAADGEQEWFDTRYEAIRRGLELAEQERGELVIHGSDGKLRPKD